MNAEEQRIAIAEACGLTFIVKERGDGQIESLTVNKHGQLINIPDYLNDLNGMHEAEKTLTQEQISDIHNGYVINLKGVVMYSRAAKMKGGELITSTASQRAEAFLRTLGKWKE